MSLLSDTPGRVGTLEAQRLLEVPVPGGFGVWLDENWKEELQGLLERSSQDVDLLLGHRAGPDAAQRILEALPPGRGFEDKFAVGVFDREGRMAGVLVVVRDHPAPREWTIDLLLVRADLRGRGLAVEMLQSLEAWVRSEGGRAIRLPIRRSNPAGAGFAMRVGFDRDPGPAASATIEFVRRLG